MLCLFCLQNGLTFRTYYKKGICRINGCKGRHNHLLHLERFARYREASEKIYSPSIPALVWDFCANVTNRFKNVLLRIAPVSLRADGREISTYAFLIKVHVLWSKKNWQKQIDLDDPIDWSINSFMLSKDKYYNSFWRYVTIRFLSNRCQL